MSNHTNPTDTVEELEMAERIDLEAKYKALVELKEDKRFQVLVLDGYLKEKAVEMTSLLAVPGMQAQRSQLFEALAAISHFENYLMMVESLGAPVEDEE